MERGLEHVILCPGSRSAPFAMAAGGLKEESFNSLKKRKPEKIIERAVWGMLPKNRLGRSILKKLYVYRDETHPHGAQNPSELSFDIKKVVE